MTEPDSTNIPSGYDGLSKFQRLELRRAEHRERWLEDHPSIPYGNCLCGCGKQTRLSPRTSTAQKQVKGAPLRYFERHDLLKSVEPYKVEDRGHDTPCWIWLRGTRPSNGGEYGTAWHGGKRYPAHRLYYQQEHGPIPEGLELDHLCRQTLCVRPSHLEPVTGRVNVQRGKLAHLTNEQVQEVRRALAEGTPQIDLARYYEVSPSAINHIAKGRTWR